MDESIEGHRGLIGGQYVGVLPSAQNAGHLDIEMLWDGKVGTRWYELAEGFPAGGFSDEFDTGGGIEDYGDSQMSPSVRSSERVDRPNRHRDRRPPIESVEPTGEGSRPFPVGQSVLDELERRFIQSWSGGPRDHGTATPP